MKRLILIALLSSPLWAQSYKPLTTPNDHHYCESTTTCNTPAIDTTGAKLAVAFCAINSSTATCSLSSSYSASFVQVGHIANATDGDLTVWYALSPSTSASSTITCTSTTANSTDCGAYYFSLSSGHPAFDTSATAQTSGSAAASLSLGSMTLDAVTDLVVTVWASQGSPVNTMLISSPFALAFEPTDNSGHDFSAVGYTGATDNAPHNMTTDSAPAPFVASANNETNPAFWPFNGVFDSLGTWLSNTLPAWHCIDLGSAKTVNVYGIMSTQDTPSRSPKDWTFSGSNTSCAAGLVTLDTQAGVTAWFAGPNYGLSWPIANTTAYRYYRFDITANNTAVHTGFMKENLYTLGNLASTTITPVWSICSGTGCAASTNMVAMAVAFKISPAGTASRTYVIRH